MATNFKEGGQNTSLSPREKLKQGAANAGATVTDQSEPFAKMEKDSPAPANSHANKAVLSANITSTNQQQNLQSNKNKNSSLQPAAPQQQPTTAASEKVNDEKIQALQKMIESQADPNSIEAKILMEALSKLKLTQQTNVPKASSPIPEKPASVQNLSPIQAPSSQPQDTNNPSENSAQVNHNTTQSPQSSQNNINSHPNSPLTHDPRSKQNSGVSSASHNSSFHQYQQQIGYRQQYEKHNKKSGNPAVIPTFEQHNAYSRKVFVGGLPPDIEVNGIKSYFNQYGKVNVDWPHKNESNSLFPPKGYCFLLFHHEDSVAKLVNDCVVEDEKLYLTVNSNTIKNKQVQIRSWQNSDSDYVMDADMKVSSLGKSF